MRGQRLYVRPIEPGDGEALGNFMDANAPKAAIPAFGLVGKLVGELVAVMSIELSGSKAIRIDGLVVVPELRRKRIGRVMMNELESLAARMERDWLVVDAARTGVSLPEGFLKRVGFVDDGERMVRRVAR